MPLTNHIMVEADGGLSWKLFYPVTATGVVDDASLHAFVDTKIAVADSWLKRHLGSFYALADPDALVMQIQAESYLTLHYLTPILRAAKTYGIHDPIMSEESSSYDSLIERNWKEEAQSLLDEWLTVEQLGSMAFAQPTFGFSPAVPIVPYDNSGPTGLDPRSLQLEEALSEARGRVVPVVGGGIGF
jgi:hypothetical protein